MIFFETFKPCSKSIRSRFSTEPFFRLSAEILFIPMTSCQAGLDDIMSSLTWRYMRSGILLPLRRSYLKGIEAGEI